MVKNPPANAGDIRDFSPFPGWEDPLEEEMAIRWSCLENPRDRGAWQATVYGVTKSRTWLCIACCRYQIWSVLCTDTNLQPCALRAVTSGVGVWCWSVRSLPAPEPVWVSPGILMLPEGCSYKSVFTKLNVCLEVSCGIETLFALLAEDWSFHCSIGQEFGKAITRLWHVQ